MAEEEENLRIENHPQLRFDRGERVTFSFQNHTVTGYMNEPLGVALQAEGFKILSRSFKYHRPRGLYCLNGTCPNCTMNIDGTPNLKACEEPTKQGTIAKGQHCWPSLTTDFGSILEKFDFLFPVGFQYKRFIKPRILWPIIDRIIRRTAGVGDLPNKDVVRLAPENHVRESLETDVLVLGGGPSGVFAALEAAKYGANVILVERKDLLGGNVRLQTHVFEENGSYKGFRGFQVAGEFSRLVAASENIKCLQNSTVIGYFEEQQVAILQKRTLLLCKPRSIIVATGTYEQPMIFRNNDLPGVMLSTGVQILLHKYGVKPGLKAVVITNNEHGYIVARNLQDAGIIVVAIADSRVVQDRKNPKFHGLDNTLILDHYTIKAAKGSKKVQKAILTPVDEGRKDLEKHEFSREVECDTICICGEFAPSSEILAQADVILKFQSDGRGPFPEYDKYMRIRKGLYVAGSVAGAGSMNESILQGRLAGVSCVIESGLSEEKALTSQREIKLALDDITKSNQKEIEAE